MRKFVIGAVAVASIVGGSAAVAAVNPLVIAGAQGEGGTSVPTTAAPAPSTGEQDPAGPKGPRPGRGPNPLQQTLDELVANGTITQAQADAITNGVKDKVGNGKGKPGPGAPGPGAPGPGGPGRGGKGHGPHASKQEVLDAASAAIGIDAAALETELRAGRSIGEVATARGVDPQKVIDAVVAAMAANIDEAVAAGKIPAERAAALKEKLGERAQQLVTKGPRGPKGRGPKPAPPAGDQPSTAPTTAPTTTTTTAPATPGTPGTTGS